MNCKFERLVSLKIDNRIRDKDAAALEGHLPHCPQCSGLQNFLISLRSATPDLQCRKEADTIDLARFKRRLPLSRKTTETKNTFYRFNPYIPVSLAASVAFVVLLSNMVFKDSVLVTPSQRHIKNFEAPYSSAYIHYRPNPVTAQRHMVESPYMRSVAENIHQDTKPVLKNEVPVYSMSLHSSNTDFSSIVSHIYEIVRSLDGTVDVFNKDTYEFTVRLPKDGVTAFNQSLQSSYACTLQQTGFLTDESGTGRGLAVVKLSLGKSKE